MLDRELFFGNPEIAGAQISPDGQYIAFLKPWKDTRNVWVKKTGEPFTAARLVTADTKRPIPGYFWSRDSKYILFVQDNAGDENYNVYAVDPGRGRRRGQDVPPARNLTDAKGARASSTPCRRTIPDTIYVGLNDRDAGLARPLQGDDLDRRAQADAQEHRAHRRLDVRPRRASCAWPRASTDNGDTEVLRVDADGFKTVYTCTVFETCGPDALPQGRQARLPGDEQGRASI